MLVWLLSRRKLFEGIAINPKLPGCLANVSADGVVRIWDYNGAKPIQVAMQHLNLVGLD